MSPVGKPRLCTHVRLSTTLSSPSQSAQYSTPVSVIAYTSRSLRTSLGTLDWRKTEHPIWSAGERRDETRRGEWGSGGMEVGVRGGGGSVGQKTDLLFYLSGKWFDWALITLRGNEGVLGFFFRDFLAFMRKTLIKYQFETNNAFRYYQINAFFYVEKSWY